MWKFSMDRHALQSKARDDGNLFFQQDSRSCGTPKEAEMVFFKQSTDSKICGNRKNAENVFFNTHKGGRICDEKALFYKRGRRDFTRRK